MNTAIVYKIARGTEETEGRVVVVGEINNYQKEQLASALKDGKFFIAEQIGFPALTPPDGDVLPEVFHQLVDCELVDQQVPDEGRRTIGAVIDTIMSTGFKGWKPELSATYVPPVADEDQVFVQKALEARKHPADSSIGFQGKKLIIMDNEDEVTSGFVMVEGVTGKTYQIIILPAATKPATD